MTLSAVQPRTRSDLPKCSHPVSAEVAHKCQGDPRPVIREAKGGGKLAFIFNHRIQDKPHYGSAHRGTRCNDGHGDTSGVIWIAGAIMVCITWYYVYQGTARYIYLQARDDGLLLSGTATVGRAA